MPQSAEIESPIAGRDELWRCAWAVTAAFGAYFCVYAFRKPFTAASFDDPTFGVGFKATLVAAQTSGYALSKFLGIKIVSEVDARRRVAMLLCVVALAGLSLVLFGVTPPPWNAAWLFANGLSLGVVFGLVLGFLEGRRQTEILTAGLCASFIVADGVTKSAGAHLLSFGVRPVWMPAAAAALFTPPLLLFAWMLSRVPPPSPHDIATRSERPTMNGVDRLALYWQFAAGLTLLVVVYVLITILRSVRADFAPEIWAGLHAEVSPNVFAITEMIVATAVLILVGATVLFKNHRRAFFAALAMAFAGIGILAVALLGLRWDAVSPFAFMILMGIGLYLPYIVVHTTLFERLLAATRARGNVGYLMYLADSFGYLGTVAVLVGRNAIARSTDDFMRFFVPMCWVVVIVCSVVLIPCWRAFARSPGLRRTPTNINGVSEPTLGESKGVDTGCSGGPHGFQTQR